MITPWLWPLAIVTLLIAALGVLVAQGLRQLIGQLMLVSVGTLLAALAMANPEAIGAALYYLVHSTLVCGALYLLAGLIVKQRGKAEDRFVQARRMCHPKLLGGLFFIAALSVIGLPPFSGFVGKALVLKAASSSAAIIWLWPPLLLAGLAALVAVARAGTTLFWRTSGEKTSCERIAPSQLLAVLLLLSASPLLALLGGPVAEFTLATANQMAQLGQTPQLLLPTPLPGAAP